MARRKNGAGAIEDTRQLLADANSQIEEVRRRRAEELRGNASEAELDRFDAEIKRLEVIAGRHEERIRLFDAAEVEAENERRVREKASLIERIEKRLSQRHAAALEIAEGIKMADAGLRKLIDIARDSQAAWSWQASDLAPTLLAPSAIISAIEREIYRQGARPVLGGGMDKFGAGINFPGGKPTRIELAGMPQAIKPLADLMQEATNLAAATMRAKTSNAVVAPVAMIAEADRQRTPAQAEMAKLLQRQNELSADPTEEGERQYKEVVAQIAEVSQRVENEKDSTHA